LQNKRDIKRKGIFPKNFLIIKKNMDNKEYSLKGLLAPIGTFQSLEWEYLGKWL
jgi:hypothetical protein